MSALMRRLRSWVARHWLVLPPELPGPEQEAHYRELDEHARVQWEARRQIEAINRRLDQMREGRYG